MRVLPLRCGSKRAALRAVHGVPLEVDQLQLPAVPLRVLLLVPPLVRSALQYRADRENVPEIGHEWCEHGAHNTWLGVEHVLRHPAAESLSET